MQRVSSSSSPDLTSTSSSFTCHDSVMCVCVVLVEYGDYLTSIAMVKFIFLHAISSLYKFGWMVQ